MPIAATKRERILKAPRKNEMLPTRFTIAKTVIVDLRRAVQFT